jgi:hypothetical protein
VRWQFNAANWFLIRSAALQSSSVVPNASGFSTFKIGGEKASRLRSSGERPHGLHSITAPIIPAAFQNPPQKRPAKLLSCNGR